MKTPSFDCDTDGCDAFYEATVGTGFFYARACAIDEGWVVPPDGAR